MVKVIDRRAGAIVSTDYNNTVAGDGGVFDGNMAGKRAEGDFQTKLKTLLERIDIQAQKLSERLDIGELKRYRTLVTEFLDVSVKRFSQYHKEHTLDGRGRHRIFGIVRKVDQELEALTREVIASHKDNIGVLAKLDDIRGLLVDIIT